MEVPERLALIGGSILLASTLVFTLKSQASQILPKVNKATSHIFDHIGDAQQNSDFDNGYKDAQQRGWQTGYWGTAKFYINNQGEMNVGSGQLQGKLYQLTNTNNLKKVNFMGDDQAPSDSSYLLSGVSTTSEEQPMNDSINSFEGLDKLDTSQVTNMYGIFGNDAAVKQLNLSSWDVSNVKDLGVAFNNDNSLRDLNVADWHTSRVDSLFYSFFQTTSLKKLDLSNWHTPNLNNMQDAFRDTSAQDINMSNFDTSQTKVESLFREGNVELDSIKVLSLGNNTYLRGANGLPHNSTWKNTNSNQTLSGSQLQDDSNSHPGTWIKQ